MKYNLLIRVLKILNKANLNIIILLITKFFYEFFSSVSIFIQFLTERLNIVYKYKSKHNLRTWINLLIGAIYTYKTNIIKWIINKKKHLMLILFLYKFENISYIFFILKIIN